MASLVAFVGDRVCVRARGISTRGVAFDFGDGFGLGMGVHTASNVGEFCRVFGRGWEQSSNAPRPRMEWCQIKGGENKRRETKECETVEKETEKGCGGLGRALLTRQAHGDWDQTFKGFRQCSHLLHGVFR